MKFLQLLAACVIAFSLSSNAFAEETLIEKLEVQKNDTQRSANKAINRAKEAACTGSEAECMKQKAEHRASEAYDATKDKASELKNKIN